MSGLTRKKITVRGKNGKTFQRSVMARAEAIGRRVTGKKLNSLNPWEAHHTAHVKGDFPKSSGSSGPGSDHSLFAILAGYNRERLRAGSSKFMSDHADHAARNAAARRADGVRAVDNVTAWGSTLASGASDITRLRAGGLVRNDLIERHGRENVHEVYQDPRRHVRE